MMMVMIMMVMMMMVVMMMGDDDHDDNGDDDDGGDDDDHHDDNDDDDLSWSGQTIAFDRSFTKSKYNLKFIRSTTHVQKVYIHEDRFSTYNS